MIVTFGLLVLAFVLLLLAAAVTALAVAAPWLGEPAPAAVHWRVGRAVVAFDFWLEVRGVRGRRRRELRDELRANLYEASAAANARDAVAALGPLRALAREYAAAVPPSPAADLRRSPTRGSLWAGLALAALAAASLVTSLTWVDAALAADVPRVAGRPVASPWLYLDFHAADDGFSLSTQIAWWVLLVPAVAYVVGAKLWRRPARARMAA